MTALQIFERIAPSENVMLNSLFQPVTFSDGSKGTYSGFIGKVFTDHIRFCYGKEKHLMINRAGVIGQWSIQCGATWFHYVLSPFGDNVKYSVECEVSKMIRDKFWGA